MPKPRFPLPILALALLATPAAAQVIGGLPSLPGPSLPRVEAPAVGDLPRTVRDVPRTVETTVDRTLTDVRRLAAQRLLREHPEAVEADDRGRPVVRGEILALATGAETLARLREAGFSVKSSGELESLGLASAVITPPRGLSAVEALKRLKALDPEGQYDFNHIYQDSGAVSASLAAAAPAAVEAGSGARIGLVDGSVGQHPSLAGAKLVQKAFAPGGSRTSAHATAVASLMVGQGRPFHGAAPGAMLMVADVYGPTPAGGSAQAIARGLAWMAETRTPVVNVSLVGPSNAILAAAVRALVAKGHLVVAAVGNDGPSAPPLYPAAYPGVVAVTGVDARRRVLPEAGRGTHVDFAAPGAEMAAGAPGGGYVSVRGTSFAAPIAAGRLAALLHAPDPAQAQQALAALGREATDLGARGPDAVYGRGGVGLEVRTDPRAVGARAYAARSR